MDQQKKPKKTVRFAPECTIQMYEENAEKDTRYFDARRLADQKHRAEYKNSQWSDAKVAYVSALGFTALYFTIEAIKQNLS